jgi:FAD/FMN-containing dehydrogenase
MAQSLSPAVIERLTNRLSPQSWTTDPDLIASHLTEWRRRFSGATPLLAVPSSTEEVSALVGACAEAGIAITPQGGNTGLVGAQIPKGEILISLKRMNKIRNVSPEDDALTAEAGVVLTDVHSAAAAAGRVFPLSLASQGSATIGGLISTNAGGVHVVRFGMMREQVLGLEVVLPDGRVLPALKSLRKDNTGYDLKQMFIGAEGTLGIITAATLKLQPKPAEHILAAVSLEGPEAGLVLLHYLKSATGALVAYELMNRFSIDLTVRAFPHIRNPLPGAKAWQGLIEFESVRPGDLRTVVEEALESAMEKGLIDDAAIAESVTQAADFWKMREDVSAAERRETGAQSHMDISIPVARVPDFIRAASDAVLKIEPRARIAAFGHAGDGNIHYTVLQWEGAADAGFAALLPSITQKVQDIAVGLSGSISAEHGIGVVRREELPRYKDAVTLDIMAKVKAALDPQRIMNPRALT